MGINNFEVTVICEVNRKHNFEKTISLRDKTINSNLADLTKLSACIKKECAFEATFETIWPFLSS